MRWFVRGDLDGFFGLAVDNLVQLLLIDTLCRQVLGFDDQLLYQRVLPGVAVSLLVGNLFYSWQASRLAKKTNRTDVCALPYGINTVSLIAYVFFVMLPAKQLALERGDPNPSLAAWHAGLVACVGCGLIEFLGAFVAEPIRKATPRAALLSTLAGIALGFLSLGFLFRTYTYPVVGLATLSIVLLIYFGKVRFRGGLPGGLVAVGLGTALAWITGLAPGSQPLRQPGFFPPIPVIQDLAAAFTGGHLLPYISIIIPMGLFNLIGSLQNIESAEAAGDLYDTRSSLAVNGLGTLAAALFGSCFPTTIYIGHPGWKGMGARAGYSVLNGFFFTAVCLTGLLGTIAWAVPVDAGLAIVVWIGLVITAQAYQATPPQHAPAVVVGLLPAVAAWGVLMAKTGLRVAGTWTNDHPFSESLISPFERAEVYIGGGFALEQGFIFTSIILSAVTVAVIERRFNLAAMWCGLACLLSITGLMHSYRFTPADTAISLTPAWPWVTGYAAMGISFLLAQWLTVEGEGH